MQILITDNTRGHFSRHSVGWKIVFLTILLALALVATSTYIGFRLGSSDVANVHLANAAEQELYISQSLSEKLSEQQMQVDAAVDDAQENLNALAMRLGFLQAKVTRLEALGSRLTRIAGLSSDEFDFEQLPAVGGTQESHLQRELLVPDFIESLESLSEQIVEREQHLTVVDSMMLFNKLELAAVPSGNPVSEGWVSSNYGKRTDPMTGKHDYHKGIDLAGVEGTEVKSVGTGVVTWSGKQRGYGNVVEVDHGHGYVTRYAHNAKNLVEIGDRVEKGQTIGLMGSTGRSTGPHVHFEVEQNGKLVDPKPYLEPIG